MGREIKRVPLDFNWPINRKWGGYINPFEKQSLECPHCKGSGYSKEAKRLVDQWYGNAPFDPIDRGSNPITVDNPIVRKLADGNCKAYAIFYDDVDHKVDQEAIRLCNIYNSSWRYHLNERDIQALVEAGRLMEFTHVFTKGNGWQPKDPPYIPTPEEVNNWSLSGMGHDSCNQYVCVKAECDRFNDSIECKHCDGEGTLWPSSEIKEKYENWQDIEPPNGDGWQLWENVSEGSPISPVFSTPEELAKWLINSPEYSWKDLDAGTTYEQWLKFITGSGDSVSMVIVNGEIMTGVQAQSL